MITAVPAAMPVTVPVDGFTVAIDGLELLHVPPVGEPVSVLVELTHMVVVPEIVGSGLTVTTTVLTQPAGDV